VCLSLSLSLWQHSPLTDRSLSTAVWSPSSGRRRLSSTQPS
jgi:hypothetical protein